MPPRDGEPIGTVAPWPPPGAGPVLAVAGAWLLAAVLVGVSERLSTLRPPAPQLVLAGLTIALLLAARLWTPLRQFVEAVDPRALVLFHVTRFVGFYFLVLHARGDCPGPLPFQAAGGTSRSQPARCSSSCSSAPIAAAGAAPTSRGTSSGSWTSWEWC